MKTLIITRGVPASGKSTWAKQWVENAPLDDTRVRLNRDDLRFQMFGKYWCVDEQAVTVAQDALMVGYMKKNFSIVLDNTNLRARDVKSTLALAAKWGYAVEFKDFPVSLQVALARDVERSRQVGPAVIEGFFSKFIRNGNLPDIPTLDAAPVFPKYQHTPGLREAILVDIDGTLAHMVDRSPYDYSKVHEDTLDEVVASLVDAYHEQGYYIIVMSGRPSSARGATIKWLKDHGIKFDELFMRGADDLQRNDAVVKNELFEQHIAGRYNIHVVLDDRDRVVEMWRAKGLKTLQVEPGDF